ncbi:MAG: serine/threonine protein kinase [Actinomycetota bacterium]|nr:serine/threonine protein kinase [Actinomycetota bacterium]
MERVGEYRLLRQIGEGGMGVVHLALAPDNGRVAVKVLRPQVIGDREARQRLEREVAAMRRIRNPRVAECLDADPWGQPPYVVTRFVAGLSLAEHVAEYGPMPAGRLIRFAQGAAQAIASVHAAGILHRDIKPSNVLLDRDQPVLIDFGLAMAGDESRMTHAGWVFGTPSYLAPEIVLGDDPLPAADIHAWAATVIFAATGRSPYGSGPAVAVLDRIRRAEYALGDVPGPLVPLLTRCLDTQPHQRPTAVELCTWLEALGGTESAEATQTWSRVDDGVLPSPAEPDAELTSVRSVGHPLGAPSSGAPSPATSRPGGPPRTLAPPYPQQPLEPGVPAQPESPVAHVVRTAAVVLIGVLLAGAYAVVPFVTAVAVAVTLVTLRADITTRRSRLRREQRRGPRIRDSTLSVLGWPVHALRALPVALLAVALALLLALGLDAIVGVLGPEVGSEAGLVGGAVFALAIAIGPATWTLRASGHRMAPATLTPSAAAATTISMLLVLSVLVLVLAEVTPTGWFPLAEAPWLGARRLLP